MRNFTEWAGLSYLLFVSDPDSIPHALEHFSSGGII